MKKQQKAMEHSREITCNKAVWKDESNANSCHVL